MAEKFDQTVWKGFEALQSLSRQASHPPLATSAKHLHECLAKTARGGPAVAFIAAQGEEVAPKEVVEAMGHFIEEVERLPPKYEQPAFQCLSDYKKAQAEGTSPLLAGFILAICLAERLLKINFNV